MDANLDDTWYNLMFYAEIDKYLRLANTIEALFEAFPMAIL